jgi:hypothetical protein
MFVAASLVEQFTEREMEKSLEIFSGSKDDELRF